MGCLWSVQDEGQVMIQIRYVKRIVLFALFLAIIAHVSANIDSTRGITSLFIFEKEGVPYNGNINYTISCALDPALNPSPSDLFDFKPREDTNPWAYVFALSGNCSSDICPPIAKMSWYVKGAQQPRFICGLNGSIANQSITTWNETEPEKYEFKDFYDTRVVAGGKAGYYNYTPKYLDCNRDVIRSISYRQYPCQEYLANYSMGYPSNPNWTQTKCEEVYNHEIAKCYQFLKQVDLSWNTNSEPIIYIYKFNLSSANDTIEKSLPSRYIPQSPVESLYCTILKFFGGMCD